MLISSIIDDLPTETGVYLFLDSNGKVIYVGKAKSLRHRVAQYLRPGGDGRALMPYLQQEACAVSTVIVSSEAEALLLENNLIKYHQPKYNILLKDDKSYMALKLVKNGFWPKLELVRYSKAKEAPQDLFGPYSTYVARQMEQFVHENFMLRRCSDRELKNRSRPCILHGIKRCMAPCVNLCTREQYQQQVDEVYDFLSGRSQELLRRLDSKIEKASEEMDFEKAAELFEIKQRLSRMSNTQSVDVLSKQNAELLHLEWDPAKSASSRCCLGRVSIRDGRVLEVSTQLLDAVDISSRDDLLQTLAVQHVELLGQEAKQLRELWLDLDIENLKVVESCLKKWAPHIVCRSPSRGHARQWRELARRNCEQRLINAGLDQTQRYKELGYLKQVLELENLPVWIECLDTSHHRGKEHVASLVAYLEAQPAKSLYRHYRVQHTGGDDYGAMREVLKRRFERAQREQKWPDLLIIDGGQAHLNLAQEVLRGFDLVTIEVASISKDFGKHTKGLTKEWLHRPGGFSRQLDPNDPALHLVQRIRDEAHRRAIEYHRKRRSKVLLGSALDDIPGIGPRKKAELLKHFGSVTAIRRASLQELEKLAILNRNDRLRLIEFLGMQQS